MKPVGAEDGEPSVAPGAEPVGREPVDADVAGAAVAAQHHVAEVLEPGVLRVVDVAHLRGHDLGSGRAGEEEELVELVRGDVAEDAAVALLLEEPGGPGLRVHPVRPEADGLDDLADGAGLHQLARLHRGPVLEPLAVDDRVDAARLRLHPPHLGQLLERRHAGLVDHEVLAVAHDLDAERRALVRDRGAGHELDRGVLEDLALAARELRLRKALGEGRGEVGLLREEGDELPAPRITASHWELMWPWLRPMTAKRSRGAWAAGSCAACSARGPGAEAAHAAAPAVTKDDFRKSRRLPCSLLIVSLARCRRC